MPEGGGGGTFLTAYGTGIAGCDSGGSTKVRVDVPSALGEGDGRGGSAGGPRLTALNAGDDMTLLLLSTIVNTLLAWGETASYDPPSPTSDSSFSWYSCSDKDTEWKEDVETAC